MAEDAAASAALAKGRGLRVVLIVIIVILVVGAGFAWFLLKPTPPAEMHSLVWPGSGAHGSEEPLKLTATLSDGSYHLLADIRLETARTDLTLHQAEIMEELNSKKSLIQGVLTEVANSLDQTTVHSIKEFKSRLLRKLNEKIETTDIEDISIQNWLVQPTE